MAQTSVEDVVVEPLAHEGEDAYGEFEGREEEELNSERKPVGEIAAGQGAEP